MRTRGGRELTRISILHGSAPSLLRNMDTASVDCVVTSPPYWRVRDYGVEGQIGQEPTVDAYVASLVDIFRELRRVLSDVGTLWLNLGDCYATAGGGKQGATGARASRPSAHGLRYPSKLGGGVPQGNLIGIPWRVALAMQADGWVIRNEIIWNKPNAMPESIKNRLTSSHEKVFLFTKVPTGYGFWPDTISDNRHPRDLWSINTSPYPGSHRATMPLALAERCVLAGSQEGAVVLDPFAGAGTTLLAAVRHGRQAIGIEINPEYIAEANDRLRNEYGLFLEVS